MSGNRHFIRQVENFYCGRCGVLVRGNGYTNHCPQCLYSKHVDLEVPGDRASVCQGLMKPVGIGMEKGEKILTHRCLKCGKIMKNKAAPSDNFEEILKVSGVH